MTKIVDIRPGQMHLLSEGGARYHQMIDIGDFNAATFEATWDALMRATNSFVLAGQDETGFIAGGIGCVMSPAHSTNELIATMGFWFVHPEHRGLLGARLLRAAEDRAIELGADRVNVMLTITRQTQRIGASLRRHGYAPFEVVYSQLVDRGIDQNCVSSQSCDCAETPATAASMPAEEA